MRFYEKKYIDTVDLSNFGAFSCEDTVDFKLLIPRRCGATQVVLHLSGEGIENKYKKNIEFCWESLSGSYDVFSANIDMSKIGVGLYYYKYQVSSDTIFYLGESEYSEGLSVSSDDSNGSIQLLIYNEKSAVGKSISGGTMYQIFVDRFNGSGKCTPKNHAIINHDWYNGIPQFADYPGGYVENNMFFGGDLYGIVEKLDYIQGLGVNILYLCPIFDAYSNHKYDTGDYLSVDSMFGSDEALDLLIKEANERHIKIILDGVFNHTGSNSIYFNKNNTYKSLGAYQSKNSQYYEWYNFRQYPDNYECWWNVKILPRVNSDCESYKKFIFGENGVIEKWMKKGIYGFRLDVADELSDNFLKGLNNRVRSINPDGVVYGEVWEDASNKIAYGKRKKYFLGNELDSVMNYPMRNATINYIKNGDFREFYKICKTIYGHYPKHTSNLLMNFLGTHDTERILTVLGGEDASALSNKELSQKRMTTVQKTNAKRLLKLAYAIIATIPGIPCIYYGDEAGMEGYRDPFNRMPFPWGNEDKELLDFFAKIGNIRKNERLYKESDFKIIFIDENVLAFARYSENESIITIVNRSKKKFYINSSKSITNIESGRKISVLNPQTAVLVKSKGDINELNMYFSE